MTTDADFLTHLVTLFSKNDREGVRKFCVEEGGGYPVMKRLTAIAADASSKLNRRNMRAAKAALAKDEHPDFPAWYKTYPKHVDRSEASDLFSKTIQTVPLETLLEGARRYAGQCASTAPEFIKSPARWLRRRCWEDEYPSPVQPAERQSKILRVME